MILEKQTEAMVQQEGQSQDSITMSLDLDSAQILMQMLSKNLYSDAIGSTIRECASNALDSHRRANITDPIVVSFYRNNDNNYEFSVEDFGIGLNAEDVKNIISKYGKSTKRNSANELGMMGLGFKAPLAYSSSFYFVCRKDGMERKYMMYEGEDTNTIDLLYEAPTKERNGVKVIVPVKYFDRSSFISKIKEQLAYFESVYFNVDGINNDFTIIRHEHFQFSSLVSSGKLHICLDNVYYPIDFEKLGISGAIQFPVALRFGLSDGLFPTPNRESIRYTKEAVETINKKIADVANYFVEKYNSTVSDADDINKIFDYYTMSNKFYHLENAPISFDVNELKSYSSIDYTKPKLTGVELLDLEFVSKNRDRLILGEYEAKISLKGNTYSERRAKWISLNIRDCSANKYYIFSERMGGKKKDYIKSIANSSLREVIFIKKTSTYKLGTKLSNDYSYYRVSLNLDRKYKREDWRQVIKEFQYIQSFYTKKLTVVEDIEIPQAWLDARKKVRVKTSVSSDGTKKMKLKGQISCKKAKNLDRYVDGKNCKFVSTVYDLATIHKEKYLIVYGKQENADEINKMYQIFENQPVEFITLSDREFSSLDKVNIHNLIPFSKFMEGKCKPFRRLATACLIKNIKEAHPDVFMKHDMMKDISSDLCNLIKELDDYCDENYNDYMKDENRNAIIEASTETKLYDTSIHHKVISLFTLLNKFPFINSLLGAMSSWRKEKDPLIPVLADMFKYNKHRIDWKNYNIKLNEDVVTEETLTEESVDELVNQ